MKSKKIIAIGGGEIGRPGFKIETEKIDREIIKLSGKKNPKILFIPTASKDSESYYNVFKKYFEKKLRCKTDVLYLIKKTSSKKEIKNKILKSDIIYVGGGNTLQMLKIWRKKGIDKIIKKAYDKGIIMSGLSAGAICWFKYGNSDSISKNNLIKLKCLNFINLTICPHYNIEKNRRPSLKKMIKRHGGFALALDNCAAIQIIDNKYRIITSKADAKAYKLYKKKNKIIEEIIKQDNQFKHLNELRKKI